MARIKPGRYTSDKKGFITYPHVPEIANILLQDKKDTRYLVFFEKISVDEMRVNKPLWNAIQRMGGTVKKTTRTITRGRKEVFGIPVEIRKISDGNQKEIQTRVTGNTTAEVILKLEAIKKGLEEWDIKPRECVWERTEDPDIYDGVDEQKNLPEQSDDVQEELKRLRKIVESVQADMVDIKEKPIKKAMKDDRAVMKGILR